MHGSFEGALMSEITPDRPNDHRRLVGWQGGEGLVLGLLRGKRTGPLLAGPASRYFPHTL